MKVVTPHIDRGGGLVQDSQRERTFIKMTKCNVC